MLGRIAAFIVGFAVWKPCLSACPGPATGKYGTIYHFDTVSRTCEWIFGSDNLQSDVILSVMIIDYYAYANNFAIITLPHGGSLPEVVKDARTGPWCYLYVKQAWGNETTCKSDIQVPGKCSQRTATLTSNDWPPRMKIHTKNVVVHLAYAFLDCRDHLVRPVTVTASKAHQTTATATSMLRVTKFDASSGRTAASLPTCSTTTTGLTTEHWSESTKRSKADTVQITSEASASITRNEKRPTRHATVAASTTDEPRLDRSTSSYPHTVVITLAAFLCLALVVISFLAIRLRSKNSAIDRERNTRRSTNRYVFSNVTETVDNVIYQPAPSSQTEHTVYDEISNTT